MEEASEPEIITSTSTNFKKRKMKGHRSHGRKKGKTGNKTDGTLTTQSAAAPEVKVEDHGDDEDVENVQPEAEEEATEKVDDHSHGHGDGHSHSHGGPGHAHDHAHDHAHHDHGQPSNEETGEEGPQPQDEAESVIRRKTRKDAKENPLISTTRRLKELARKKEEERMNASQFKSKRSAVPTVGVDDGVTVSIAPTPRPDPNKPKWFGPMKESSNVRTISRFDYQPDLCKDYKDTGYCGYGDSCKFLHDRGDYKTGWQLEREWEEEQKKRKKRFMGEDVDDDENFEIKETEDPDKDLPFACLICRNDFVKPIQTKCKHYFCEKCALTHYAKDSRCFVCREQTNGIFNTATRLLNAIATRKRRLDEEAQRAEFQPKAHNSEAAGWAYPKGPEAS